MDGTHREIVAFRYTEYDVPFWVRPNSRGNRWNEPGDIPTQYLSLTPEGAWAELIRKEGFRDEAYLDAVKMPIWAARIPSVGFVNLFDPEERSRFGLSEDDLTDEDHAKCQGAASAIRAEYRGLLCPSAALPDAVSLVLFGPRRRIALDRDPKLASAIPADVVAIGRPPKGLAHRVSLPLGGETLF